jgi:hypothetical protein
MIGCCPLLKPRSASGLPPSRHDDELLTLNVAV